MNFEEPEVEEVDIDICHTLSDYEIRMCSCQNADGESSGEASCCSIS